MQRRFFSNLSLLFILNILIKPVWIFGIDRKAQVVLGTHNYGLYYALFNLSIILNIILDMGITNFINREVAHEHGIVSKYFGTLFSLKILLFIIYAAVVLSIAWFIHIPFNAINILFGIIGLQFFLSLLQFIRAHISGMHLFVTDSLLSVFDKSLVILLCGSLLYLTYFRSVFSLELFIFIQLMALFVSSLTGFIIITKKVGKLSFKPDSKLLRKIVDQSKPYALTILLMAAYSRLDGVMLERLGGPDAAGQYAKDFRIYDACNQFGFLFAGLLLPIFTKMLKEKKNTSQLAGNAFNILFMLSATASVIFTIYSGPVHALLYHENKTTLGVLIWAFIGSSAMYVFSTLLTANWNINKMILMAAAGVALNVSINSFITPTLGPYIASVATCLTQTLMASMAIYYCYKLSIIDLSLKYWLKLLAFTGFLLVTAAIVKFSGSSFWSGAVAISLIAALSAIILNIISVGNIKEILQRPSF